MIIISDVDELKVLEGKELGLSDWLKIDQHMIDAFGQATGDLQWIHVDPQKAAVSPFGATIAHGFLLLALLPKLKGQLVDFQLAKMAINYGTDKVRFLSPVPVNSSVRLRVRLMKIEETAVGIKLFTKNNLELQDSQRDGLYAETITLLIQ